MGDEELGEQLPKMDARVAEALVRKWQNIKSQAFGPDHCLGRLQEVRNVMVLKIADVIAFFQNQCTDNIFFF